MDYVKCFKPKYKKKEYIFFCYYNKGVFFSLLKRFAA